jgi:hypothetical protein
MIHYKPMDDMHMLHQHMCIPCLRTPIVLRAMHCMASIQLEWRTWQHPHMLQRLKRLAMQCSTVYLCEHESLGDASHCGRPFQLTQVCCWCVFGVQITLMLGFNHPNIVSCCCRLSHSVTLSKSMGAFK